MYFSQATQNPSYGVLLLDGVCHEREHHSAACVEELDSFGGDGNIMIKAGVWCPRKLCSCYRWSRTKHIFKPGLIPHITANRGMVLAQENIPFHSAIHVTTQQLFWQETIEAHFLSNMYMRTWITIIDSTWSVCRGFVIFILFHTDHRSISRNVWKPHNNNDQNKYIYVSNATRSNICMSQNRPF